MKVFKPVPLAGLALAASANAQTFVPFHSGVNLSVAPSVVFHAKLYNVNCTG
jgi:hypothetical protein